MANMSASILRNLVSSVFDINPNHVRLSGEIAPDFTCLDSDCSGGMWDSWSRNHFWGFSPKRGFIEIPEVIGEEWGYNDNVPTVKQGKTLAEVEGIDEFLFFLHNEENTYSDSNGRDEEYNTWALYKAPDFAAHWAKIEDEDVARWEQWLSA